MTKFSMRPALLLRAACLGGALFAAPAFMVGLHPAVAAGEHKSAETPAKPLSVEDLPLVGWGTMQKTLTEQLNKDQKILQEVSSAVQVTDPAPSMIMLNSYTAQATRVRQNTAAALTQVEGYQNAFTALLEILGDKPQPGEPASITQQRQQAQDNLRAVKTMSIRIKLYDLQARQLLAMLGSLSSQIQQATLSRRSLSPLTFTFWAQLESETVALFASLRSVAAVKDLILLPLGLLLVFLGTAALGRFLEAVLPSFLRSRLQDLERLTIKRQRHDHHNAQDSSAGDTSLPASTEHGNAGGTMKLQPGWSAPEALGIGLICATVASVFWALWSNFLLPHGYLLLGTVATTIPACTFVLGGGIPLSHWRSGRSMRTFSLFLSLALMSCAFLETFQNEGVLGNTLQSFLEACVALAGAFTLYLIGRRLSNTVTAEKEKEAAKQVEDAKKAGKTKEVSASLAHMASINLRKPFYALAILLLAITGIAVACGYITFAFSLTSDIVDLTYAVAVTGVLAGTWQMVVSVFFSPNHGTGRWLRMLGVSPRRMEQMGVILSAAGSLALIMVLIALLQTKGDLSFSALWSRLSHIFTGTAHSGLALSPETAISCILLVVAVHYGLNFICTWLLTRLFPTTNLDNGAQTSIISILSYTVWIMTGLTLLSMMGVSVQNLTWVVSALSVGVGFGLQSIVKDFISGIILLAGRPIQPGNVIIIGGIKGVVQRINIRATDITLIDGATLIVPNSQLVTSNVTNASFGDQPTNLSLNFTLSRDVDLDKAQALMLAAANDQPLVLALPAPGIITTALDDLQVTMCLTVSFYNVKNSLGIKSALLQDVLKRFHEARINVVMS
ncbi:mechanosensitive ion channel family protein [Oecophyllibacter saccharovorans]|uniref:mechanosensitive ion channel family protein n=1 Tax=Oecophyllibacter saccharovorans TaxID=2558360 RepID=UPI001167B463|nr:mechanosensitive ion channel domain-containing protein [Oecophyllibacter saccharovorans]TPW36381.1 mechanosensitive ion channel [Oecophyllibacter saccharovorans]